MFFDAAFEDAVKPLHIRRRQLQIRSHEEVLVVKNKLTIMRNHLINYLKVMIMTKLMSPPQNPHLPALSPLMFFLYFHSHGTWQNII
jgi:hypothetical protein